jgi:UDP-galactopyranose mutase
MIVERIAEYNIDPDEVAVSFHDDYQDFILKTDNEDTWDFVYYFIETFGFDYMINELALRPESFQDSVY